MCFVRKVAANRRFITNRNTQNMQYYTGKSLQISKAEMGYFIKNAFQCGKRTKGKTAESKTQEGRPTKNQPFGGRLRRLSQVREHPTERRRQYKGGNASKTPQRYKMQRYTSKQTIIFSTTPNG